MDASLREQGINAVSGFQALKCHLEQFPKLEYMCRTVLMDCRLCCLSTARVSQPTHFLSAAN